MSVDDLLKKKGKFSQESLIFIRSGYGFWFDLIYMERRTSESSIYTPYLAKLKLTRLIIHRMQEN
jgi:hypothetical protein